jgi:hypothetical protein
MNAAASAVSGEVLVAMYADSVPPRHALRLMEVACGHPRSSAPVRHPARVLEVRMFRRPIWLIATMLLLLASGVPAWGESPFVTELAGFFFRYHEDPPHLDVIRAGLEEAVKTDPDLSNLLALAQLCFLWGDIRGTTVDQKLAAYDEGRQAARRAVDLAPKNAVAHLWYATNTARWGQSHGVVRSLFLLPTVTREIHTVLGLDPGLAPAYALAGNVYYEVPGLLGGDIETAERMFRKGLALDPRFTGMRVGLAKTLLKEGRHTEAREELTRVLAETAPANMADWTLKDRPEARRLLGSVGDTRG